MTEVSIILGAGFSAEAKIPLRKELNSVLEKLTSQEFITNSLGTSYFLNEPDPNSHWINVHERNFTEALIKFYTSKISKKFDYEDFYDYCHKVSEENDKFFDSFFCDYAKRTSFPNQKGDAISKVLRTIDFLVADLLRFKNNLFEDNIINKYSNFLKLIRTLKEEFSIVNIFTLNHDLLLENLLQTSIEHDYSDGFEIHGTKYYIKSSQGQVRIKYFNNKFDKPLKVFKLHGSVDNYIYNYNAPYLMLKIPACLDNLKLFKEFKSSGKWNEENCWTLYQPEFLSGTTRKILNYSKHDYYKKQFKHFNRALKKSNLIISIGYGLEDTKINEFINNSLGNKCKLIVVKRTKQPEEFFTKNIIHYGENLGVSDIDFENIRKLI